MRSPTFLAVSFFLTLLSPAACTRDVTTDAPEPPPAGAAPRAPAAPQLLEPVYRIPIDGLPSMGDRRALVTVVAFTDYQCPFCAKADKTITELRAAYGADLRVVVAERPLPFHERARPAALAALAAAAQGKLEPMHAALFARHGALDEAAIEAAAAASGLDLARFDADRASDAIAKQLDDAEQLANRLGVHGTPTFFVNGRRVVGAQPLEALRRVVDAELATARARVAAGTLPEDVYEATVAGGEERVVESDHAHGEACGGGSCAHGGADEPEVGEAVERVPTAGDPVRGPAQARSTVVVFADFECPYCAKAQANLQALERAHPEGLRIVFKQRPLPMHEHARVAAKASLAADAQGKFWEMYDQLFSHAGALDRASIDGYAAAIGLDMARFARDMADPALDARIAADDADADALHVTGTPTLFVNGHRVIGAQPVAVLERALAK